MFNNVKPILDTLFVNGTAVKQPIDFEWWLIRRKGHPFLLLPASAEDAHVALELYSAQRWHAKIMRALLPLLLKTPASAMFERVRVRADASCEMLRFMAEQSGVPAERLRTPAIKVGGLAVHKARLVMLLCDSVRRPVKVIKVGVNPKSWVGLHPDGWKATEQEANQLAQLPPDIIGCIRMTGRHTSPALTAFATTYFSGDSPRDDAGMENLFHSWLNPQAPVPVENLHSWRELKADFAQRDPLMWQILNQAVTGKKVHGTLHHGDFAPWNIRATGEQNLQVFDWERGRLQDIPGWDWFHFYVQTAILARRCHEKRVAAEVENLFQSPRFRIYAKAARITDIVKPLFLAYLLHQKWVVKPLEGGATTEKLYELLVARWQLKPFAPAAIVTEKTPLSAWGQLKSALSRLSDLVWEPTLSLVTRPSIRAQISTRWPVILMSFLLFCGLAGLQSYLNTHSNLHLSFNVFYLIPCLWLTLTLDRRWGAMTGTTAAIISPLLRHLQMPEMMPLEVTLWNVVMRFILFQIIIILVDRIYRQNIFSKEDPAGKTPVPSGSFADHWAVIIASGFFFAGVIGLDALTNPQLNLLPLYLLPCMILTLAVDWRWGTAAAVITAIAGPFTQRFEDPAYRELTIESWNTVMRLLIFLTVVWLLNRIRRENVLFFSYKPEDNVNISDRFSPVENLQGPFVTAFKP